MVEMKAKALGLDTLFQTLSLTYVVLVCVALAIAVGLSKTWRERAFWVVVIGGVFFLFPIGLSSYKSPEQKAAIAEQQAIAEERAATFAKAKALFDEKCKTAGERIYKTVENVEGVLLPKIRESRSGKTQRETLNYLLWPDAALAQEHTGDLYIERFLTDRKEIVVRGYKPNEIMGRRIVGDVGSSGAERGLRFVDVIDSSDGKRYRVTASAIYKPGFQTNIELHKEVTTAPIPRYAVTFENNVDPELRKHWVAGTTVKVIDLKNKKTLGELEVWKFGSTMGMDRQASAWAASVGNCPSPPFGQYGEQTHYFVEKILKAKQGK